MFKNRPIDTRSLSSQDNAGSFRALKEALRRPITSGAVRNAIHTTVAIVASYLVCSGLHLVLTVLERTDAEILKSQDDLTKASDFHTTMGDTVSFLYMFTSAIRILIYCKCNPLIRLSVKRTLNICPQTSKDFHKLRLPIITTTTQEDENIAQI